MEFYHVYNTQKYLDIIGYNGSLVGQRFRDMETDDKAVTYIQKMRSVSEYVNKTGFIARYIGVNLVESEHKRCYVAEESLIIDPVTQERVGRLFKINLLNVSFMWQFLQTANNFKVKINLRNTAHYDQQMNSFKVDSNHYPQQIMDSLKIDLPILTEREREVLFLLIIGEPYKSIAGILSMVYETEITETAIKSLINRQLFDKFNVSTRDSLIKNVIQNNLVAQIPERLLTLLDGIVNIQFINSEEIIR